MNLSGLQRAWLALGWLWVAVVCVSSLLPHPPELVSFDGIDKLEHLLAYAWLMLWFCQVYVTHAARISVLAGLVALGVCLECLQGLSGYRYFEYTDMLANSAGVLLGWGLAQTPLGRAIAVFERDDKY